MILPTINTQIVTAPEQQHWPKRIFPGMTAILKSWEELSDSDKICFTHMSQPYRDYMFGSAHIFRDIYPAGGIFFEGSPYCYPLSTIKNWEPYVQT